MGGVSGNPAGDKGEVVRLPVVPKRGEVSVEEAIWRRRSIRRFTDEAPKPDVVSRLCWAAQGITDSGESLRSAPSAGATYPLELFLATSEYVARYVPNKHHLVVTKKEDIRRDLAEAALGQFWFAEAPVVFVFAGDVSRTAYRYGDRATMYVHIEVGCASENLMLEAAALGWGSTAVGAFRDDEVRDILELPKGWEAFLIVPIGVPAP
jgi:SagB-type dehydrogenase family enzyme